MKNEKLDFIIKMVHDLQGNIAIEYRVQVEARTTNDREAAGVGRMVVGVGRTESVKGTQQQQFNSTGCTVHCQQLVYFFL